MTTRPLVLLVDDDPTGLDLRADAFAEAEFSVIRATHVEHAMRELWSSPMISLLYTDVNLAGKMGDMSGITLKDYVREVRPGLPIVGYSGIFEDQDIPDHMTQGFTAWYPKGRHDMDALDSLLVDLHARATEYAGQRRSEAEMQLGTLRERYKLNQADFDRYRALLPNEDYAVEQVLSDLGYSALLIQERPDPSSIGFLRAPFLFWSRPIDDGWEVELFGMPSIYAVGESEDDALTQAIELFGLFAEDIRQGGTFAGPAAFLADFVRRFGPLTSEPE